jgi:hypothetical protein
MKRLVARMSTRGGRVAAPRAISGVVKGELAPACRFAHAGYDVTDEVIE